MVFCLLASTILAQSPQTFKYQAVVRDNAGEILANTSVSFRVSIHDATSTGSIVYQETHSIITNQFGLASLEIGNGLPPNIGSFPMIDWGSTSKFLEIELDPTGSNIYTSMGTSQLLSVPYALYAERATLSNDNDWVIVGSDMFADVNGNVGIGEVAPSHKLTVNGGDIRVVGLNGWSSMGDMANLFLGDLNHGIMAIHGEGLRLRTFADPNHDIRFQNYLGEDYMTINMGTGNVGIGTTIPENAKLEIVGDMFPGIDVSSFMANGISAFSSGGGGYAAGSFNATEPGTYGILTHSSEYEALFAETSSSTHAAIKAYGTIAGDFEGRVNIGTTLPGTSLEVSGPGTSLKGQLCITDTDGDDPFLTFYENDTYRAHLGYSNGSGYLSTTGSSNLIIQGYAGNTGNVGIGWDVESDLGKQITKTKDGTKSKDVSHKLTIYNASDIEVLRLVGPLENFGHGSRMSFGDGNYSYIEEDEDDALHIYTATRTAFTGSNVGIGTLNPSQKLDVDYGDAIIQGPLSCDAPGEQATLYLGTIHHYLRAEYGYGINIGTYAAADVLNIVEGSGNVGIGTTNPTEKLTVKGNIRVESATTGLPVVELGEGLDYAEGFDLSDSQKIMPGNVLIIDPDNPGELTLSKQPYDSKVAGIVAGANDLGSGIKLGTGQFDCDVALAGRVYCNVDASYGAVSPGDLLTTSTTPGYAMIVKDEKKASGAILGKAMESLKKGEKGQILVLVTLQ